MRFEPDRDVARTCHAKGCSWDGGLDLNLIVNKTRRTEHARLSCHAGFDPLPRANAESGTKPKETLHGTGSFFYCIFTYSSHLL